mgnify:CR=1 FL=1
MVIVVYLCEIFNIFVNGCYRKQSLLLNLNYEEIKDGLKSENFILKKTNYLLRPLLLTVYFWFFKPFYFYF